MKSMGYSSILRLTQSAVTLILCLVLSGISVSPIFAAAFPIATSGAAMSAAFDGSKYLVGVENHLTNPTSIGFQMLNSDGTKSGSLVPTGRTGIATNVAFDGTNYLLIWEDDASSPNFQVYGLFISKSGVAVGLPFAISGTDINFDGVKTMAYGGGKYLVTYTKFIATNRYIYGRIVNPDGSPMAGEFKISTGTGKASDVAFDGTNFFVIWCDDSNDSEIKGRFVSPAGVTGTEISINASVAPSDNPNSVTFDGTNYLVVWNDETAGIGTGTWDVFGQLVSSAGALVGGAITITNETGPQMVTSVAFDGTNYLAVWMDMSNDTNGDGVCGITEGSCWDMYGHYISRNGSLVGSKITINTDPTNQIGGVGFANGRYLVLMNNGVIMGEGGITSVASANGMYVTPPTSQYSGDGSFVYSGDATGGALTWNWTNLNFLCDGPTIGIGTQNITDFTPTSFTWTDSPPESSTMTWTRISGSAIDGSLIGTWTSTEPGSGNSYTLTFTGTAASGTVSITADIFLCNTNNSPSITSFSLASTLPTVVTIGKAGDLVAISGNNFSPRASENSVLFNGVPSVVTDVRSGYLYVLVPPGATTGTISVTTRNGTATSAQTFSMTVGTSATTLNRGGVHHRLDSNGVVYDALDVGINSYAHSLAGMTLSVKGPAGFENANGNTYTFTDADLNPNLLGQLAVYKKYISPATLPPGVYTYTLNDGQGHISHRVDTHVTVAKNVPQVDSATIQLQRLSNTGNDSYRISWAPVNDTQTYFYRVRIFRNDVAETNVYDSTRAAITYVDIPEGILFDDTTYKLLVEAGDSPNGDLATNRSDSAWKLFSPMQDDYNPNMLLTNIAMVNNRTNYGTAAPRLEMALSLSDPSKVTSLRVTGPVGFTPYDFILTTDVTYSTPDGTTQTKIFYKHFTAGTTMPTGLYTFTFVANGLTHTAYATLTAPVTYNPVDVTTMQAQELPDGLNVRFSWANANNTGALYYRVTLFEANVAWPQYSSSRLNQAFVDIPKSIVANTTYPFTGWRVELYDSSAVTTQRNRFHSADKLFSTNPIIAYDATSPVINNYRVRNMVNYAGVAYSHISVNATGTTSALAEIRVTRPDMTFFDLLSVGRYSPVNGAYTLEQAGTLATGRYTITARNAVGLSTTRLMYVPPVNALPQPDFTTAQIDTEINGDMRISWAPVVSNVPVWYSFRLYSETDLDGDAMMNGIYSQLENGANNFQKTSIVIPAATFTMPATAQVSVADGSGFSVTSNVSSSVFVGSGGSPVPDPFAAGNDALVTAVIATYPANLAVGVPPVGNTINVAFNKVIDQRSLPANFTLSNAAGSVFGAATYDPATRTATFATAPLELGTTYTASLSTGLLDQAGNALSAPYSWSFTTAGSSNKIRSASGTYSFNPATGALATTTTASDFACDGPGIGLKTETVLSLTTTTMTWQGMPQPWTRLNGIAGDITGTWRMTDTVTGTAYTFVINANGTFSVSAGMFMCGPAGPLLSVTIVGGGNVNSDTGAPGIHGTVAGTFSSPYLWVAPVVLTETPHAGWDFSGWSGDCTPSGISCSLIVDAPAKNVTANFKVQQNIKVGTSLNYYGTIQEALNLATDGSELRLQKLPMVFTENPVYNRPAVGITPAAIININGGWDSEFTSNVSGMTVIKGILRVQAGRLNVQKIIVQK